MHPSSQTFRHPEMDRSSVCVGVGQTKTLAKLANHCAKKHPAFDSDCNFNSHFAPDLNQMLSEIAVGEIWGVGRKLGPKLQALGNISVVFG